MRRWLVTGGAGFIGSHFIRFCLENFPDVEIINLDKLTYSGNRATLAELDSLGRHRWVGGDISDRETVQQAMNGCEYVINFAAETHVDRSIQDAFSFVRTNVLGTHTLLEEARLNGVARFLHVSTDEVYGSISGEPATETSPLNPTNPYSASKTGADLLALSYFKTHKLPVVITRSSNNFGPYQYPEKMIPLFITEAIDHRSLPLYGDGAYCRDWVYVLDNVRAIYTCLEKGMTGGVYNIAGSNEWQNIEVARLILKFLGKSEDLIKHVTDRLAHDRRYALADQKLRALGWAPSKRFEEALEETVQWYVDHERWWLPLKKAEVTAH